MVNKQKMWFITLFSLILILSVYYITMPSELLTTMGKNKKTVKAKETVSTNVTEVDPLEALQVELDEERESLAAEYNKVLTNKDASTDEKNTAYNGLKTIDGLKSKEQTLKKLIKDKLKLDSFVKIENSNISVTIKKKEHDYALANSVMRLVQSTYENKVYTSVK